MLSPWSRMKGLYFNEDKEPDNFMYNFKKDMDDFEWEHGHEDGKVHVRIKADTPEQYYENLNKMEEINSMINVYINSSKKDNIIVEKTEDVDAKLVDEDDTESDDGNVNEES